MAGLIIYVCTFRVKFEINIVKECMIGEMWDKDSRCLCNKSYGGKSSIGRMFYN